MTFLILAALAGAIANRIRGGLFPLPDDAPGSHTLFCGAPAVAGRSYCAEHMAVCFIRHTDRRANLEALA